MRDTCVIERYTPGANTSALNEAAGTFADGETTRCGFLSRENAMASETAEGGHPVFRDIVYMPLAMLDSVASGDRLRLTHRHGIALAAPLRYAVEGDPFPGVTALRVTVRALHGGGDRG